MKNKFDNVSDLYDSSLQSLPIEYCKLIKNRFKIKKNDKIIDLGCGSGLLTFELSRFSDYVEGIDISKKMIKIAKNRDKKNKIQWYCSSVEEFDFDINKYSLIIAYESFHLFSDFENLIKKCELALKNDSYITIGWCNYAWEERLKDTIINVFKDFDIDWGKWGYQRSDDFFYYINRNKNFSSPITEERIQINTKTHFQDIITYLASIDKVASFGETKRSRLIEELRKKISKFSLSDYYKGITSFYIAYSKK